MRLFAVICTAVFLIRSFFVGKKVLKKIAQGVDNPRPVCYNSGTSRGRAVGSSSGS